MIYSKQQNITCLGKPLTRNHTCQTLNVCSTMIIFNSSTLTYFTIVTINSVAILAQVDMPGACCAAEAGEVEAVVATVATPARARSTLLPHEARVAVDWDSIRRQWTLTHCTTQEQLCFAGAVRVELEFMVGAWQQCSRPMGPRRHLLWRPCCSETCTLLEGHWWWSTPVSPASQLRVG